MKKLNLFYSLAIAALMTGCMTSREANLPEPNSKQYYDYGAAMKSTAELPLLANWQIEHAKEIEEATKPAVLERFLESAEAADALLAEVKADYKSDPMKLTQIAAVTQLVMCPKCPKAKAWRMVWTQALARALDDAEDEYRVAFYRDQLNWCRY